jgi:predicted permease
VLADVETEFRNRTVRDGAWRAGAWCWRQVAASLPALVRRSWWRGWTGFEPQANVMRPGGPLMERWLMDARYAARRLIRRPVYTAVATLTLALGIGGTSAIFGLARGVLFERLPYADESTIGLFWMPGSWRQQEFAYLRGRFPGFAQVAQYAPDDKALELGDGPARLVPGIAASSELFSVLGTHAALGRTFDSGDDVRGAGAIAVLSYGLWQDLGGDATIVGRKVRLDGLDRTVVGVMPRGFWFPTPTVRVWVPEPLDPNEDIGRFSLVGRVTPESQLDALSVPIARLTGMLRERFTYSAQFDKTREPWIRPVRDVFFRPLRPALFATLIAMGLILLIACANVAALMLGQVEGRASELALRSALGAHRRRLAGQLLAEGLLFGAVSGMAGAALAAGAFRLLLGVLPLGAWADGASLDWTVFAVAMVVALASALAVSLVPTFALWRGRLHGVIGAEHTAGRGARLESSLVVAEVALAVLMAAGAGVLLRSVNKLNAIDTGIRADGVGVVDVQFPTTLTTVERTNVTRDLLAAGQAVPGVAAAGVVQHLPLRGGAWSGPIVVEGKPDLARTSTFVRFVSADYLATMGIGVRRGRGLEAADIHRVPGDTSGGVVVINEALAKKYFDGEDPIGRRISAGFSGRFARIVGVVRDVAEGALTDPPAPVRYSSWEYLGFVPTSQALVFKAAGKQDPVALLNAIRDVIRRDAPRVAIQGATTMDQVLARAVGPVRQVMMLVTLLTTLALVLCAIGTYGVISHFVLRRQRDWGIRIALGLRPSRVVSGIVARGASLVLTGIALGLVAFVSLARFLATLLYGVHATDPLSMAGALSALLAVGVAAAAFPAARASRINPAIVLREQ